MSDRVDRLRASLEEPLLVSDPTNLRYLTGFASSNAVLLVEPDRLRLFADFRYAEAGRAVREVEFVQTPRALYADLPRHLSGRIGFEADSLTWARWRTLADGGFDLVPRTGLVESLRKVKDEGELEAIRRAAAITDEVFERLAGERFTGRTERELAWWIERLFRELGADGLSFDVTVATGPNGSRPHAEPGERTVEPGHLIVVDAGCVVDGYCSDCTRTFAAGDLPDELRRRYEVCLEAELAALEAVRPGATGREADAAARDRIAEAGFGEEFGHGLGHGVGLAVHEAPTLRPESSDTLAAGNVVTVEPGIYLAGAGGVRIEDLVVVRDGGPEVLSRFTKELVTVA
jgi:Xaa-Pro aminopeptidase